MPREKTNSRGRGSIRKFDATKAECFVFVFKEGLLSAVAHDLKLAVEDFKIEIDPKARTVNGWFDPSSIHVVAAMRDGRDAPRELSDTNKKEIERNIARDVLLPQKYPDIRFASKQVSDVDSGFVVKGILTLCGKKKEIPISVRYERKHYVAEATVCQLDFGIRPYSALMGTLKVKADVLVRIRVPGEKP